MKHFFLFLKALFSKKSKIESTIVPSPSRPKTQTPITRSKKKKKWSIHDFPVEQKEGETKFHDHDLPVSVMHAIFDLKFSYCTPIQAKLLPIH